MNERQERRALLAASLVISGISLVTSVVTITVTQTLASYAPPQRLSVVVPACPTEDSTDCYWDADTMGNGIGQDSITFTIDSEDVVFPSTP